MVSEFLPIGSVVLLNGGTKKVMVTGFCSIPNNNNHKLYDYCGCVYPEGIINSNEVCLFNNDQIASVCFKGYQDEDEAKFQKELKNVVSKIKLDSDHNMINENLSDTMNETSFSTTEGAF